MCRLRFTFAVYNFIFYMCRHADSPLHNSTGTLEGQGIELVTFDETLCMILGSYKVFSVAF